MSNTLKKIGRVFVWIVAVLLGLILLVLIAIQIPFVQNFAKDKAVVFLQDKLQTEVVIGNVDIGFPKKVILNDIYLEDQQKDTLLYAKKIAVDVSLFKLLSNTLEINSFSLENSTANISKNSDSIFNFDYIIKAFDTPKDPKDDSAPMEISIKEIKLKKINFKYDDAISKNDFKVKIGDFEAQIDKTDIEDNIFEVDKIKGDKFVVILNQGINEATKKAVDKVQEETKSNPLALKVNSIHLTNSEVVYKDASSKLDSKIAFSNLYADVNMIDLEHQKIALDKLIFEKVAANLVFDKREKTKESQQTPRQATDSLSNSNSWAIQVKDVSFAGIDFKFDDNNSLAVNRGMDYKHLNVSNLNFKGSDISYGADAIKGNIKLLNAKEQSGLHIIDLQTDFLYAAKSASLKNLYLETPQTILKDEIIVTYPSLDAFGDAKQANKINISTHIKSSKIGFKDILLFAPQLAKQNPFQSNPSAIIFLNTDIEGTLNNLNIPKFQLKGFNQTALSFNGNIAGLPNFETTYFTLNQIDLKSSARDVNAIVPKNTLPNSIELPATFAVKGDFEGTFKKFITNLDINSTFGQATTIASFDQSRKNQEKYQVEAKLNQFNVGKLIKNNEVGVVSATAFIKGTSLDPKLANATLVANVKNATFKNYKYTNVTVDGDIANGSYDLNAKANDPNLKFKAIASGGFNDEIPFINLNLNLEFADLNKLNLHAGPLKLKGDINADFESLDVDNLNGNLDITNLLVALEKEQFPIDTISLRAVSSATLDSIYLKSQFANVKIVGDYKLSTIATALQNSVDTYFNTGGASAAVKNVEEQFFDFDIVIKDEPILMKLEPKLTEMSQITLQGSYNSVNDSIVINGVIPRVEYSSIKITGATLNVNKEDEFLAYILNVGNVKASDFEVPQTQIAGKLGNNEAQYALRVKDLKSEDRYVIEGKLTNASGKFENNLNNETLLLNYDNWTINPENIIRIADNALYINNFKLSNSGSELEIQSQSEASNAPIDINFTNFNLETLTSIASSNFEIGGKLNGITTLSELNASPIFVADLEIENLTVKKDTVGNLKVNVDNKVANVYAAHVQLTGNDNDVDINGTYQTGAGTLNFKVDIEQLQMKSLQAFTLQNITESEGYLDGKLVVTGKAANPSIVGDLKFNEVAFNLVPLNSKFKLLNDKIAFKNNVIVFDNFKLKDENDNDLKINGKVLSGDFTNLGFDLNIVADNFRAVNSEAKDNDLFYGELYLDNNINVKGDMNNPVVDGKIKLNPDTKFTIVLPPDNPSIESREGVVQFIDQDQPVLITVEDPTKQISQTQLKGINASLNIEIDKDAEISIIIDKANGDFLKLKGEAQLTGGIDPSGKTTLTGKYEFTEGSYEMNFNLIKRKFDIKPGSSILWTGEPTTAIVDVTAIYRADIAPIDLVDDQLAGVSADVRNTYKQKIPVETELKMKGELLQPKISFDIVLPDGNNNVSTEIINTTQAKLDQIRQQEDLLNKQVFAILLLNRFIGENPFQSETGGVSGAFLAKQSASRILSEQLNNLTEDWIKGFELDFDLQASEDYTSGQKETRTDLNVGLSKKLLNDRLKVTIGSNFGLEGNENKNEDTNNIAGDVQIDYLLTKDGRYKLKGYRKNDYQVALQGQVIETGVAFIVTMNYDKFRELFEKTATEITEEQKEKDKIKQAAEEKKAKEEREAARAKEKAEKAKEKKEKELQAAKDKAEKNKKKETNTEKEKEALKDEKE